MVDIADIASPDAPTTVNEKGGGQSHIPVRFDLIDAKALFEMAKVLDEGARKYGEDNWRLIDVSDHLNHLIMHAYAYLSGDRTDEHLSHALCRATFALGVALADEEDQDVAPDEDLLMEAWGIIANASGGDWGKESEEWRLAAHEWRQKWHATLRTEYKDA